MTRNDGILIGALILGLVGLGMGGAHFVLKPLQVAYDAQIAQKQDLEKKLATARQTAAQFGKFKAQAENLSRNLAFYESRTDGTLSAVEVGRMLAGLANQMDLREWSAVVTAHPPAGAEAMGQFQVHAKFNADFDRLGRFLNACVSQRRLVIPVGVDLRAMTDPSGLYYDTLAADLDMTVYGGSAAKPQGAM